MPIIAFAWAGMLLASSLVDILWFELTEAVSLWLLWVKIILLGGLILLSWLLKPSMLLRSYFVMLLAITSLMWVKTWLLDSSAWMA